MTLGGLAAAMVVLWIVLCAALWHLAGRVEAMDRRAARVPGRTAPQVRSGE
jgi:hypothetical protein